MSAGDKAAAEGCAKDIQASSEVSQRGFSRRTLFVGAGMTAALCGLGSISLFSQRDLVRPPGAQDEQRLLAACVRCEKCVEVCPHDIIKPAHIEDGIVGVRTPVLDFSERWCDWCADANAGVPLCEYVCPTEAMCLPVDANAETTILGKAVLDENLCLAFRATGCRFCYDACRYDAIELDVDMRPRVKAERCNGCGACESVCVSLQNASVSNGVSKLAVVVVPVSENEE